LCGAQHRCDLLGAGVDVSLPASIFKGRPNLGESTSAEELTVALVDPHRLFFGEGQ
jgi:hypothetical protein